MKYYVHKISTAIPVCRNFLKIYHVFLDFHHSQTTVGGIMYVMQKKFWMVALLGQYSIVFHFPFPGAVSFSYTVNTVEDSEDT